MLKRQIAKLGSISKRFDKVRGDDVNYINVSVKLNDDYSVVGVSLGDDYNLDVENNLTSISFYGFPINALSDEIIDNIIDELDCEVEREEIKWNKYEDNQYYSYL